MIWIKQFLRYMNAFIIVHASVTYYHWQGENEKHRTADLKEGYKVAFLKHFGSIVVTAPILPVVKFLKFITASCSEKIRNPCFRSHYNISDEILVYIATTGKDFQSAASDNHLLQSEYRKQFKFTK